MDINRYAYAGNDPVNGSDANGHAVDRRTEEQKKHDDELKKTKGVQVAQNSTRLRMLELRTDFNNLMFHIQRVGSQIRVIRPNYRGDTTLTSRGEPTSTTINGLQRQLNAMTSYRDQLQREQSESQITPLGGVYALLRGNTVIYVGRSNDLYRRQIEHRSDDRFNDAKFMILSQTNVYAEQRISEQRAISRFGQGQLRNLPQYNHINGISNSNSLLNFYNSVGDSLP